MTDPKGATMNAEQQFQLRMWALIVLCVSVLIVTVGLCTAWATYRITSHADPIAAACALGGTYNAQCIAAVSR